jgi:hypothetical protein
VLGFSNPANTGNAANAVNAANAGNAAFGILAKTRYSRQAVSARLTVPLRFGLGQEPVPARCHGWASGFFSLDASPIRIPTPIPPGDRGHGPLQQSCAACHFEAMRLRFEA